MAKRKSNKQIKRGIESALSGSTGQDKQFVFLVGKGCSRQVLYVERWGWWYRYNPGLVSIDSVGNPQAVCKG